MLERPDYDIQRLRWLLVEDFESAAAARDGGNNFSSQPSSPPQPHLLLFRWLRSLMLDVEFVPGATQKSRLMAQLALHRHEVAPDALETFSVKIKRDRVFLTSELWLPFLTSPLHMFPQLSVLDLQHCKEHLKDADLRPLAERYGPNIRVLRLPGFCSIAQSTVDQFHHLQTLHMSEIATIHNVKFCASTLRVLIANHCANLTDDGLANATRLEILHVADSPNIRTVEPFAHRLLELSIAFSSPIREEDVAECFRLQRLVLRNNRTVTFLGGTLADTLRELDVSGRSAIADVQLSSCHHLVKLCATHNTKITTVAPFAGSLRELSARIMGHETRGAIDDAGLAPATQLVVLNVSNTAKITSLPSMPSLLELDCGGARCGIRDESLRHVPNLIFCGAEENPNITTVAPFAATLRRLYAGVGCGMTDAGVAQATRLAHLDCSENAKITNVAPFAETLVELTAAGRTCALHSAALAATGPRHLRGLQLLCIGEIDNVECRNARLDPSVLPPPSLVPLDGYQDWWVRPFRELPNVPPPPPPGKMVAEDETAPKHEGSRQKKKRPRGK